MAVPERASLTPEEYLALERAADYKSEYVNGEIYTLAGASREHNAIVFNLTVALGTQLRGGRCRGYSSDMRVQVRAADFLGYPDLSIVCGEPRFDDDQGDNLLNPTLLIEVLSPSTERYDRGLKFAHYQRLDSLQEYVLVCQDRPRIERFLRAEGETWLYSAADGLEATIRLDSIGCDLKLTEVYDGVDFEAARAAERAEEQGSAPANR